MSNDDQTQPVRPGDPAPAAAPARDATLPPAPAPAAAPTAAPVGDALAAPVPAGRRGFRERFSTLRRTDGDRTFGLAALIASALAGIIVGGLGLTAVQADGGDHGRDRGDWMHQPGPMGGGPDRDGDVGDQDGRGPMFGGPPGMPGQVQPPAPPDDDGSNG